MIVSGYSQGSLDLDPGAGVVMSTHVNTYDVFTVKLNSAGEYVWGNSIGGQGDDRPIELAVDASDNIYLLGYFNNTVDFDASSGTTTAASQGGSDTFILKLQSNGQFAWVKTFGGNSYDEGTGLAVDSDGNAYVAFYTVSTSIDLDPGVGTDIYEPISGNAFFSVVKLATNGDYIWGKPWRSSLDAFYIYQIALDEQGDVYLAGYSDVAFDMDPGAGTTTLTPQHANDTFIIRMDSTGEYIWSAQIAGQADQVPYDISVRDAGVYVVGITAGSTDFDPTAGSYPVVPTGSEQFLLRLSTDVTAPTLAEVSSVSSVGTDTTPDYSFSTNEAGTVVYSVNCPGSLTNALVGTNAVTLQELAAGTYSCTVAVRDSSYNITTLALSPFRIDSIAVPSSSATAGGGIIRGCTDAKAKNFAWFVQHDPSLCVYGGMTLSTQDTTSTTAPSISTTTVGIFTRNLTVGSKGADVQSLQKLLIRLNLGPSAKRLMEHGATNLYGPLTRNAVREFQTAEGIKPSHGLMGPLTRNALSLKGR
ncbi:MAG: hypothetical protein QG568_395 [Patescibacteria group bacterium]|nr:hypothetical protein [Patescibacteria group bacterium]